MTTIRVQDGTRFLEFDGELLSEATSDDGRSQRWTVVKIYKTTSGRYVVHKIGESVVYHTNNRKCGKFGKRMEVGQIVIDYPVNSEDINWLDFIPCRKCNPENLNDASVNYVVSVEQPRYSAQLSDSPRGLIETLHRRDDNDVTFIPNVARNALEAAARKDHAIADAWLVQRV